MPCTHGAQTPEDIQLEAKYDIRDHRVDGMDGILSVTGVKYTTARHVAQKVVELIVSRHNHHAPPSQSDETPLIGGDIERFDSFVEQETKRRSPECTPSVFQAFLVRRALTPPVCQSGNAAISQQASHDGASRKSTACPFFNPP